MMFTGWSFDAKGRIRNYMYLVKCPDENPAPPKQVDTHKSTRQRKEEASALREKTAKKQANRAKTQRQQERAAARKAHQAKIIKRKRQQKRAAARKVSQAGLNKTQQQQKEAAARKLGQKRAETMPNEWNTRVVTGKKYLLVSDQTSFSRGLETICKGAKTLGGTISGTVALDLEGFDLGSERGTLSLVQMMAKGWPLALLFDISELSKREEGRTIMNDELCPVLRDKNILKVLHDLTNDVIALERFFGAEACLNFAVDTQIAHEALGAGMLSGLNATVTAFGGATNGLKYEIHRKFEQDPMVFTRRPLAPELLNYAALDVITLLPAFEKMQEALLIENRWDEVVEASQMKNDFARKELRNGFRRVTFRERGVFAGGGAAKVLTSYELHQATESRRAERVELHSPVWLPSPTSSAPTPTTLNGKRSRDTRDEDDAADAHSRPSPIREDQGCSERQVGAPTAVPGDLGGRERGEASDDGGAREEVTDVNLENTAEVLRTVPLDFLEEQVDRSRDTKDEEDAADAHSRPPPIGEGQECSERQAGAPGAVSGELGVREGGGPSDDGGTREEVTDFNLEDTVDVLRMVPPHFLKEQLDRRCLDNLHHVRELVMDQGSRPWADIEGKRVYLCGDERVVVTRSDVDSMVGRLESERRFGADDRAGFDGQLHRLSVMRDRSGRVYGVTLRIGRFFEGSADIIDDLLFDSSVSGSTSSGSESCVLPQAPSILVLGRPGAGKTTVIREISRKLSAYQAVVIVDTSNEIAGDGAVPHSRAIGKCRRMMVPHNTRQHSVMISALQNHTPHTIVVDEISSRAEAQACKDIKARGVRLVASAHGDLQSVLSNPDLNILVGGKSSVILGDKKAEKTNHGNKVQVHRAGEPAFDVVIELERGQVHKWSVIKSVGRTVDSFLKSGKYKVEKRLKLETKSEGSGSSNVPFLLGFETVKTREVGS